MASVPVKYLFPWAQIWSITFFAISKCNLAIASIEEALGFVNNFKEIFAANYLFFFKQQHQQRQKQKQQQTRKKNHDRWVNSSFILINKIFCTVVVSNNYLVYRLPNEKWPFHHAMEKIYSYVMGELSRIKRQRHQQWQHWFWNRENREIVKPLKM